MLSEVDDTEASTCELLYEVVLVLYVSVMRIYEPAAAITTDTRVFSAAGRTSAKVGAPTITKVAAAVRSFHMSVNINYKFLSTIFGSD